MSRRRSLAGIGGIFLLSISTLAAFGQEDTPTPRLGFSRATRAAEAKAEAHAALTVPNPNQARTWLRALTEEPHVAGTPADRKTAHFVRDKLREWGWHADIAEYEVLLNYPSSESPPYLNILRPVAKSLPVLEDAVASDKDSASPSAFPAFHGYGISGNAVGQVVYANYARPEDFTALEKLGVEVHGKIVLARYGELFRGLKVRNAQKHGAKGILIYSDPADDGYAKGDIYPEGPYRPESAIQRGSVQFLSIRPGDPSTPFGPSIKGADRLPIDPRNGFPLGDGVANWEKKTGLKRDDYFAAIPALPISYGAARPILEALAGANVPQGWQGGLPFAYHVGPGPVEVAFSTTMEYQIRPVWNVIATLKGTVEPERWVMIGNHRDAWVYGAVDPNSGTAATLEMCRALGEAVKAGWKPRRTLLYASWDAEEYGLVGSTEWAEEHAKTIDEKAVLMLNVDSAVAGPDLDVDGIPSLRDFFLETIGGVTDVRTGRSLRQVWLEKRRTQWANSAPVNLTDPAVDAAQGSAAPPSASHFSPKLDALGSGSDYTAFVDHLGVPALDVGFSGNYGVYHSVYDNFTWMRKHGDPEFITHAMAARLYTLLAMRAASSDIVPLTFTPYAEALRDEVDDLRRIVERKARAADPEHGPAPLSFTRLPELLKAIAHFRDQAESLDRATRALAQRESVPAERLARVNDALTRVERAFLLADGLPGRPWFKHAIYAPGVTTGYASWPLPGVRQAILDGDAKMLATQVPALIERIDAATQAMKKAEEAAGER